MKGRDVYRAPPTLPLRSLCVDPCGGLCNRLDSFSGKNGPCSCFGSVKCCIQVRVRKSLEHSDTKLKTQKCQDELDIYEN